MNINDFCSICGDELKMGKQSIHIIIQNGKAIKIHKWCLDEVMARRDGKNAM